MLRANGCFFEHHVTGCMTPSHYKAVMSTFGRFMLNVILKTTVFQRISTLCFRCRLMLLGATALFRASFAYLHFLSQLFLDCLDPLRLKVLSHTAEKTNWDSLCTPFSHDNILRLLMMMYVVGKDQEASS